MHYTVDTESLFKEAGRRAQVNRARWAKMARRTVYQRRRSKGKPPKAILIYRGNWMGERTGELYTMTNTPFIDDKDEHPTSYELYYSIRKRGLVPYKFKEGTVYDTPDGAFLKYWGGFFEEVEIETNEIQKVAQRVKYVSFLRQCRTKVQARQSRLKEECIELRDMDKKLARLIKRELLIINQSNYTVRQW